MPGLDLEKHWAYFCCFCLRVLLETAISRGLILAIASTLKTCCVKSTSVTTFMCLIPTKTIHS